MNNKFAKIKQSYMNPGSKLSRYFLFGLMLLCALMSFWSYYFIDYELCHGSVCNGLVITKIIADITPIYLIQGLSYLIVSWYLKSYPQIPKIYVQAIAIACFGGYIFSSLFVVALSLEIKSIS